MIWNGLVAFGSIAADTLVFNKMVPVLAHDILVFRGSSTSLFK